MSSWKYGRMMSLTWSLLLRSMLLLKRLNSTTAQEAKAYTPLLRLYLFFLFMFQTLFRLSDNALDVLLRFLAMFFRSLGQRVTALPTSFIDALPSSIHSARKVAGSERDRFDRYVCCSGCHSLYSLDECVIRMPDGQLESKKCSYVQFPSHPQCQHRKPCGTLLMKSEVGPEVSHFIPDLCTATKVSLSHYRRC